MPQITSYTALLRAALDVVNDKLVVADVSAANLVCNLTPLALVGAMIDAGTLAMTATVAGFVPTPPNDVTKVLSGIGTWVTPAAGAASIVKSSRTINTILAAGDKGTLIQITGAGGITQTYTAAATLASGWYTFYKNDSTGIVTHDPNGAETITDGRNATATLAMQPGECWLVQCDGVGFIVLRITQGTANYLQMQEQQATNTNSADTLTTALSTRTLNTVVTNTIPGATLSSNLFTLQPGNYRISASAPFAIVGGGGNTGGASVLVLTKDPAGTPAVILTGQNVRSAPVTSSNNWQGTVTVSGKFSISAATTFALQQLSSTNSSGLALNQASLTEVYSSVEIWKEA